MGKTMKPEWLSTEFINILRWEEAGGKTIEMSHSTFDQKRRIKPINKGVGLWLDRNKAGQFIGYWFRHTRKIISRRKKGKYAYSND